jgi:hypothetical protein
MSDKVMYIPTYKTKPNWANARTNLITACKQRFISDDFILMNDDFILTRPIDNWEKSISKIKGTLPDQIKEWNDKGINSRYTKSFLDAYVFLKKLLERDTIYNYELHLPMVINRTCFLEMLN